MRRVPLPCREREMKEEREKTVERLYPIAAPLQSRVMSSRLHGVVFHSPPSASSPPVILADHPTYRYIKDVNPLKAVAGTEVI